MTKKTLRTVQPAHKSENVTPREVREAWLKTYGHSSPSPEKGGGGASRSNNPSQSGNSKPSGKKR